MTNINVELFKRYGIKRKYEIVESLTEQELLNTNINTILRCVKEQGEGSSGKTRSHNKYLHISHTRRVGNNWNSLVEEVYLCKKQLYLDLYIQYSNTDTNVSVRIDSLFHSGDFAYSYSYEDRYGDTQTTRIVYDVHDKAKVIKSILLQYLDNKSKS